MTGAKGHRLAYSAFHLFFLFCFFTYVIFPVSYSPPGSFRRGQVEQSVGHRKNAAHYGFRLLLPGQVREAIADGLSSKVQPSSGCHNLLIKKRGLNPSQKLVSPLPVADRSPQMQLLVSEDSRSFSSVCMTEVCEERDSFGRSFSGTAPPRV
jgi:hypothetical protein